jgi:hypothetical protein
MTVELILNSQDVAEAYQTLDGSPVLPTTGSVINYYSVISPQDGSDAQTEQNLSSTNLLTTTSSEVSRTLQVLYKYNKYSTSIQVLYKCKNWPASGQLHICLI